jgi:hypothetical protein
MSQEVERDTREEGRVHQAQLATLTKEHETRMEVAAQKATYQVSQQSDNSVTTV